jgi:hypothetical protein
MKVNDRRQYDTVSAYACVGGTPFLYEEEYYLKVGVYNGMNDAVRAVKIEDGELVHLHPDTRVAPVNAEFSLV